MHVLFIESSEIIVDCSNVVDTDGMMLPDLSSLQVQYECRAALSVNELLAEGTALAHNIGKC